MKMLATALLLMSTLPFVVAQNLPTQLPTGSFKAGMNTIFFGSGDKRGAEFYNEYNRRIGSHVTLAPSLHAGYGSNSFGGAKGSISTDLTLFVSPMRFEQTKFRVGVGPSLRFLTDRRTYDQGSANYWTVGYTMSLEGEFNLSPNWQLGVGGSIQPYASGEIVSRCGLSVGYKF